jgi:hypothetical protein
MLKIAWQCPCKQKEHRLESDHSNARVVWQSKGSNASDACQTRQKAVQALLGEHAEARQGLPGRRGLSKASYVLGTRQKHNEPCAGKAAKKCTQEAKPLHLLLWQNSYLTWMQASATRGARTLSKPYCLLPIPPFNRLATCSGDIDRSLHLS